MIKIKLIRSPIGRPGDHVKTARALGFKKVGQTVEKKDTPQIRGMIRKIDYMLEVIED